MSKDSHTHDELTEAYQMLPETDKMLPVSSENKTHEHKRKSKHHKGHNQDESPLKEKTTRNEDTLKKLWVVSCICLIFMSIEIAGGFLANSIAIMSDAAHLLSDFLGFLISIVSIYISRKGATSEMSFGYHRAEVIGAMVSVNLIWGLTLWLLYEATLRIINRPEVDGMIMLVVAVIGFVFNVIMGLVLAYEGIDHNLHHHHHGESHGHGHDHSSHENPVVHSNRKYSTPRKVPIEDKKHHNMESPSCNIQNEEHDHEHEHEHEHKHDEPKEMEKYRSIANQETFREPENVNLRAAIIHVIGDALQNLGVVIAGLIIYFWPNLSIADPICTYIFSIIVVFTTIRILKDCIAVLMEGSPLEFDLASLEIDLSQTKGVVEVHDLHVWSLSLGKMSLSCHLTSVSPQITLKKARKLIKNKYGITHSTIQVELESEREKQDCAHDLHK